MNTLETLQTYANKHWATDKTRRTKCTYKRGAICITEKRLWVWLLGSETPVLVKEDWLTGSDKNDYADVYKSYMSDGKLTTALYG